MAFLNILISMMYDEEIEFLERFNKYPPEPNSRNWLYAIVDGSKCIYNEFDENEDSSFVLINQEKWEDPQVKELLEFIKNKNNIVWTHKTNGVRCSEMENIISTVFCKDFSHGEGTPIEAFLINVAKGNNYEDEIKELIDKSLKWEEEKKMENLHILPALSILCQGYLAVHAQCEVDDKDWEDKDIEHALVKMGWQDFVSEGKNTSLIRGDLGSKDNIDEVQKASWWYEDVFTDKNNKDYSSIDWNSLEGKIADECGKDVYDKSSIKTSFVEIRKDSKKNKPEIVAEAYNAIASELEKRSS